MLYLIFGDFLGHFDIFVQMLRHFLIKGKVSRLQKGKDSTPHLRHTPPVILVIGLHQAGVDVVLDAG